MHILVTHDDGIPSPGLLALANEMRKLGIVTILGSDHNGPANNQIKTLDLPLRIREIQLEDSSNAWAFTGNPFESIAFALNGFIKEKVDLVVSGINLSTQLRHDMAYSGAVSCAMGAALRGIPAIAFMADSPDIFRGHIDYQEVAQAACRVAKSTLQHGLPEQTLLNVKIHYLPCSMSIFLELQKRKTISSGLPERVTWYPKLIPAL